MKSHVGNREINGETYEIHASQHGIWSIMMPTEDGERGVELGHGDSLDKAVANARIQINKNKVKLHIEFVTTDGEHGFATGRHGRTRQTLAVIEGEKTTAPHTTLRGDMPQEEIDRMVEVRDRMAKLNAELREIIKEYEFDLNKEMTRQIEEHREK
jgi:protein-arginine kinase activator protein McsA